MVVEPSLSSEKYNIMAIGPFTRRSFVPETGDVMVVLTDFICVGF